MSSFANSYVTGEQGPYFQMRIGSDLLDAASFSSASLYRTENHHDMLAVEFRSVAGLGLSYERGAPVHLSWGVTPTVVREFHGYVTAITPKLGQGGQPRGYAIGVIHALGATASMFNVEPEAWVNRNIPSVITEIADRNRISITADRHDYVWPTLIRAGQTDWEWIVDCAERIGFRLASEGTHLRLYDPRNVAATSERIPELRTPDVRTQPNLRRFEVTIEGSSDAQRNWFTNVKLGDGSVGRYETDNMRGSPLLGAFPVGRDRIGQAAQPTADWTTAEMYADSHLLRNFWTLRADIEGFGDPDIKPGNLVRISGPGAEYDGLWCVIDARHRMSVGSLTVEASLGKDAVLDRPVHRPPFRQRPPAKLINSQWVASWSTS